jgi:hypothetical protein
MTPHKAVYLFANIAAIGAVSGFLGALYYCNNYRKQDMFVSLSAMSGLSIILLPFVSNLADVFSE